MDFVEIGEGATAKELRERWFGPAIWQIASQMRPDSAAAELFNPAPGVSAMARESFSTLRQSICAHEVKG